MKNLICFIAVIAITCIKAQAQTADSATPAWISLRVHGPGLYHKGKKLRNAEVHRLFSDAPEALSKYRASKGCVAGAAIFYSGAVAIITLQILSALNGNGVNYFFVAGGSVVFWPVQDLM